MASNRIAVGLLFALLPAACNRPVGPAPSPPNGEEAAEAVKGGKVGTFSDEEMNVAGQPRTYRLVVPEPAGPKRPIPLVFAFHGLGDGLMPLYSQLDALAEEQGFILVYPNARLKMWPLVPEWAKDDLAFFDALYADLTARYDIDPDRVYLTGMSNGAYFTHVIASQRSEKIAAIAVHSGGLGVFAGQDVRAKYKYAVLVVHGDSDGVVNVEEGRKTRDAYKKWGHEVRYVEIAGHNHFWALSADVNHKIGEWFADHPRRLGK